MRWLDLNTAEDQPSFDLIPNKTFAKMRLQLRPGGYDDLSQGWDGGLARLSEKTGAVYLDAEFSVLDGPYTSRKVWTLIGLYSPKSTKWANISRSLVKAMINSAYGLYPDDLSPASQQRRALTSLNALDGLEFVGVIGIETDESGKRRNVIKGAVTPDSPSYAEFMFGQPTAVNVPAASYGHAHHDGGAVSNQAGQASPSYPAQRPVSPSHPQAPTQTSSPSAPQTQLQTQPQKNHPTSSQPARPQGRPSWA